MKALLYLSVHSLVHHYFFEKTETGRGIDFIKKHLRRGETNTDILHTARFCHEHTCLIQIYANKSTIVMRLPNTTMTNAHEKINMQAAKFCEQRLKCKNHSFVPVHEVQSR